MNTMKDLEKFIAECEKNAIPDNQIDFSDIPELTKEELREFKPWYEVHPEIYKPTKTKISINLDSDVLAILKSQGKGYQSKINAILRKAVMGA